MTNPVEILFDEDGEVVHLMYVNHITSGATWVPVSSPFDVSLQSIANLDVSAVDTTGEHVLFTLDGNTGAPPTATAQTVTPFALE